MAVGIAAEPEVQKQYLKPSAVFCRLAVLLRTFFGAAGDFNLSGGFRGACGSRASPFVNATPANSSARCSSVNCSRLQFISSLKPCNRID